MRSPKSLLAIAIATVAALTSFASAQFGQAAGFGDVMSPYYLRRDLNVFVDGLDLDQGQSLIVENLFYDYEDEHNASKERMLSAIQDMKDRLKDLNRNEMLRLVFEPFERKAEEWEDLKTVFLENVYVLLNDEQRDRWPDFLRDLRREKEIHKGEFSGESVDLVNVARLTLDARTLNSIAGVINEYTLALDQALLLREKSFSESRLAMMHSIRDEDPQTALELYSRQLEARIGVREVNDQYTLRIAETMSGELAAAFTNEALLRAYARIYRPTAAQRLFAAAQELESITDETRAAIIELETAYLAEIDIVNGQLVQKIRQHEPVEAEYRAQKFAARNGGTAPQAPVDPTRELFGKRKVIDQRYVDLLRSLLTESDFASLPGASRFVGKPNDAADRTPQRIKSDRLHQMSPRFLGNERDPELKKKAGG